jgi:hypothetical protein
MILGMTPLVFVHVLISLVALGSGVVTALAMAAGRRLDGWTALFLSSTLATSLSGFVLPADRFLPSHAIGIVSVVVLAVAILAWYGRRLVGAWRPVYVVTAVVALYLNAFVFVFQAFLKVPALKALAPTQSEPPFQIAQLATLALFLALGAAATFRFGRDQTRPAAGPAVDQPA